MWQLLLGAAVAGSTGLLAKRLFKPSPHNPIPLDQEKQDLRLQNGFLESGSESIQGEIFRFSSPGSAGKDGVKAKCKKLKKKAEKTSSGDGGVGVNRKKIAVCLKKRRTSKNVAYKCGSFPSKGCIASHRSHCPLNMFRALSLTSRFTLYFTLLDSSVFRWGLGFGIMYMMSAGRAEIDKLNSTVDETARVVQELKTKLCKRKSSCNLQASNSVNEVAASSKSFSGKNSQLLLEKSSTGNRDHKEIKVGILPVIDDGEYASSVLTEEPVPESEVAEMDQLEAELELELQKLSEVNLFQVALLPLS
ncbi:hypothetical protein V6N13_148966 [Hibiscus sabdariffa]